MKNLSMLSVVAFALFGWVTSFGQLADAAVPGDHFSLEGALELFKKSESPEQFENLLNSPDSKVNNLDLNGDGYIDYIRVFDRHEGNVHVFILQAVVSDSESQDIAVIELEKLSNGKAVLQIIGDEDIYGVETIIEPTREVRTYAGTRTSTTVVNVWSWPVVHYVYSPYYTVWHSPWGWYHRPVWWRPWRPVVYVHYHDYWRPYRPYYSVCHSHRVVYAHHIYRPHRTTSVTVYNRHRPQVERYRTAHRGNGRTTTGEEVRNRSNGRGDTNSNGRKSSDNNLLAETRSQSTIRNTRGYDQTTDRESRRTEFGGRKNESQRPVVHTESNLNMRSSDNVMRSSPRQERKSGSSIRTENPNIRLDNSNIQRKSDRGNSNPVMRQQSSVMNERRSGSVQRTQRAPRNVRSEGRSSSNSGSRQLRNSRGN